MGLSNLPPAPEPSHAASTSSRDSQTFQLADGRTLGYAEYGSPQGFPVIYFHGYPTSRLDGTGGDSEARTRNIRLICPDRPGYGLSTFASHRRITDWPGDVTALVDHLGLEKFVVIGGSGGGPYAVACAKQIPKQRLVSVGVFAGAPPWYVPVPNARRDMSWMAWPAYMGAWYWPWGFAWLLRGLVGGIRWLVNTGPVARRVDAVLKQAREKRFEEMKKNDLPEKKDEIELTPLERREKTMRVLFEGFAQGPDGAVQETQLLTTNWGFSFEDVDYDKIVIWHGAKDANSPIRYMRYMAEHLPHAELREFPDDDHYNIVKRFGDFLDEVVPK